MKGKLAALCIGLSLAAVPAAAYAGETEAIAEEAAVQTEEDAEVGTEAAPVEVHLSAPAATIADQESGLTDLGDTSLETPSEKLSGSVYEETLEDGATAFVYVPVCEEYGVRATAAPVLQVYGSKPYTAETALQTAIDGGFAALADHERGCVIFVNPIGDSWAEEDAKSYEGAKKLFSDGTNNEEKVSNYTQEGKSVSAEGAVAYPGSYQRNYIFSEGAGADFVYKYVAPGVAGAGQYYGDATYKPVSLLLMNPTTTESVDLLAVDDRQVPVVIVNGDPAIEESFKKLDTTAALAIETSDVTEGFDAEVVAKAYDDVMEHYMMREMACPTSLLDLKSVEDMDEVEERHDFTLSDGSVLTAYSWAPASGSEGKPLILTMHGSGNSAEAQAWCSGLYAAPSEKDLTVLSLENYSNTNITDEMIMEAVQEYAESIGADKSRIYSSGFSRGSFKTWDLSLENNKYFAGTINMNVFGTRTDKTYEYPMPNYTMAGKESYIAPMEFPSEDTAGLLSSLLKVNGVTDQDVVPDEKRTRGQERPNSLQFC